MCISMIRSVIGHDFIQRRQNTKRDANGKRHYTYDLDIGVAKYHLGLNKFKNNKCKGFDQYFIDKLNIEYVVNKEIEFLPDD